MVQLLSYCLAAPSAPTAVATPSTVTGHRGHRRDHRRYDPHQARPLDTPQCTDAQPTQSRICETDGI